MSTNNLLFIGVILIPLLGLAMGQGCTWNMVGECVDPLTEAEEMTNATEQCMVYQKSYKCLDDMEMMCEDSPEILSTIMNTKESAKAAVTKCKEETSEICNWNYVTDCTNPLIKAQDMSDRTEQCVVFKKAYGCLESLETKCQGSTEIMTTISNTMTSIKPAVTGCDEKQPQHKECSWEKFTNCTAPIQKMEKETPEKKCSIWETSKECMIGMTKEDCSNADISISVNSTISAMERAMEYCKSISAGCTWTDFTKCSSILHTMEADSKGDLSKMCSIWWEAESCMKDLMEKGCKGDIEATIQGIVQNVSTSMKFCHDISCTASKIHDCKHKATSGPHMEAECKEVDNAKYCLKKMMDECEGKDASHTIPGAMNELEMKREDCVMYGHLPGHGGGSNTGDGDYASTGAHLFSAMTFFTSTITTAVALYIRHFFL